MKFTTIAFLMFFTLGALLLLGKLLIPRAKESSLLEADYAESLIKLKANESENNFKEYCETAQKYGANKGFSEKQIEELIKGDSGRVPLLTSS